MQPTKAQFTAWFRRSVTIRDKIMALQSDLIDALSVEHHLTDESDNVVATSEDLCNALNRYIVHYKDGS